MIARLRGRLLEKEIGGAVVDAGGVGYAVHMPLSSLEKLSSDEVDLYIHTEVRADSIDLYGFLTRREREVFRKLITVQGVGPATALAILSGLTVEALVSAVGVRDYRLLQGIPRVGRKTAERICLELAEKMGPTQSSSVDAPLDAFSDAVSALENLGYKALSARQALERARTAYPGGGLTEWLKIALKDLSPR